MYYIYAGSFPVKGGSEVGYSTDSPYYWRDPNEDDPYRFNYVNMIIRRILAAIIAVAAAKAIKELLEH